MAIGFEKARNLMRQLDWKMRVTISADDIEAMTLFHLLQDHEFTLRMESGKRLLSECVIVERLDNSTVILEYNRTESEILAPKRFAVISWAAEDAMEAARGCGVDLTEKQAEAWWRKNESSFRDILTEHGNEILSNMNFEEEM